VVVLWGMLGDEGADVLILGMISLLGFLSDIWFKVLIKVWWCFSRWVNVMIICGVITNCSVLRKCWVGWLVSIEKSVNECARLNIRM